MSNNAIASLSHQVPTTNEELSSMGLLGENIVKEYGERLVKSINAFLEQENLKGSIERRSLKRGRIANCSDLKASAVQGADEFDCGIDFSMIEIP